MVFLKSSKPGNLDVYFVMSGLIVSPLHMYVQSDY